MRTIRNRGRLHRSALSSDRETTWRVPSRSKRGDFRVSRYSHMLTEDVYASIMPYSHHGDHTETPVVQISSPNDLVEECLILALSGNDYHRNDLKEAVSDFFRECVSTIMHEGQAIYEIVRYIDEDIQEMSFSKLERVPNRNIRFFLGQPFQILPRVEDFEDKEPRVKMIKRDKLVLFKMPRLYRTAFKTLQLQLDGFGKGGVQDLHIKALEEANRKKTSTLNPKINVMDGYKFSDLAVLSATNSIGWNVRDISSKDLQEYFLLVRLLRFARFKLRLRNSMLSTINDNLTRLLSGCAYDGKIEIHGLPTEEDIQQAEQDLERGRRRFNDIIDPFLK